MRYAMRITEETASFIGKFFNDGIIPVVDDGYTIFVFGDDFTFNEIVSLHDVAMAFANFEPVSNSTLFKVDL